MIPIMVSLPQQTLGAYIKERLGDRSVRALATYAGIGVATAHNLVNDKTEKPDADTLQKVALYLDVPVENLFRLAGYMEEELPTRTAVLNEIEYMLRELPEATQKKIRDMVRVEWEYSRPEEPDIDEPEQARRKAS